MTGAHEIVGIIVLGETGTLRGPHLLREAPGSHGPGERSLAGAG